MNSEIDGVVCLPIVTIPDDRGMVIKTVFPPFIEDVYVTTVRHGAIKAWHGYQTKTIYWTVVKGLVQLVLYDNRKKSDTYKVTETFYLGEGSYYTISVPPMVFNGFKGISQDDAIILVQANEPYGQIYRMPYDSGEIGYDWSAHNG